MRKQTTLSRIRPLLELLEARLVFASDFGDAPLPYKTLLAEGGAEHVAVGPTLGASRDTEADGVHSANADGDDTTGIDDEDGVTFGTIRAGALDAMATVNVQGVAAKLDAWIDFNGDGSFGSPGEQIADAVLLSPGDTTISFDVPSWAADGTTYARFRLSTTGNLGVGGFAPDGEVEDHVVMIHPPTPACGCFLSATIALGIKGFSMDVADLDRDGDTDLLSAAAFSGAAYWHEQLEGTTFLTHIIGDFGVTTADVHAIDFDGDGDRDVLGADSFGDRIVWFENDGDQSFERHYIPSEVEHAYPADIDGDGDIDVLAVVPQDDGIAWYENDGNQAFTAHSITTNPGSSLSASDVDGDGDTDVLSDLGTGKIAWHENDGSQRFTEHTITTTYHGAASVYAADVDGDGDTDMVSAAKSLDDISWWENDGNENFTIRFVGHANNPVSVIATDMDGDGDTDILSASYNDDQVAWYENDGNQNFSTHVITIAADNARKVLAADVDGDGDLDVLSASYDDGKIAWYENLSFHVSNTNAAGPGSLRQAILEANEHPGVDTITFGIDSGYQTIAPLVALPVITDAVIIDATTQPGYAGAPLIEIWGLAAGPSVNGLTLAADNSTIKGLVVNLFDGNGILITGSGNTIENTYIGTDISGTIAVPNALNGIEIVGGFNNTIGGTAAGAANIIAFNDGRGILVDAGTNNAIRANSIHSNDGLGIDLINAGNNNQRAPSVNSAISGSGTTSIAASLCAGSAEHHVHHRLLQQRRLRSIGLRRSRNLPRLEDADHDSNGPRPDDVRRWL